MTDGEVEELPKAIVGRLVKDKLAQIAASAGAKGRGRRGGCQRQQGRHGSLCRESRHLHPQPQPCRNSQNISFLSITPSFWCLSRKGETKPFKPYSRRYPTPYKSSGSTAPYWYSIKRASAYVIVLASYSAYGKYTPQYKWLQAEFPKVNRSETPWLIVLMHAPWYNSYNYHYMEGESMRVMYEPWFVKYKVDVVFAGHVHAYERTHRISNVAYNIVNGLCSPIPDQSSPVYITIGDGGNQEGLATNMSEPQPSYSAFREASFGHAILDIKNRTHAYYAWHRNQDGTAVAADSLWFTNRYWMPTDDSFDDSQ